MDSQGIALDDVESTVYQLRNTHGPLWLKKFNLDTCPVPRT